MLISPLSSKNFLKLQTTALNAFMCLHHHPSLSPNQCSSLSA